MMEIGVSIITKNAGTVLRSSIMSVKNLAKEIVIVDDYSDDATSQIANEFNCKLFRHKYIDEGKQRIYALKKMSTDWVLVLDADEIVSDKLRSEIKQLNPPTETNGYLIPFQNHYKGRKLTFGGEDYSKLILLKRSKVKVLNRQIHSSYTIKSGKIGNLKGKIMHFSYSSLFSVFVKFTSYAYRMAKEKKSRGEKTNLRKILMYGPHMFWARFIKDKGYKDGLFRLPVDIGHAYMETLTYFLLLFVKTDSK